MTPRRRYAIVDEYNFPPTESELAKQQKKRDGLICSSPGMSSQTELNLRNSQLKEVKDTRKKMFSQIGDIDEARMGIFT